MAAHMQSFELPRVLIVDGVDPPEIDQLLFRRRGADVRLATSGRGALECAVTWPPSVLLTDLYLPDMTAFELAARLRSNLVEKRALRVFAVTSRARLQDRLRASEAGFDAFFRRPVDPDVLLRAVGLDPHTPETD